MRVKAWWVCASLFSRDFDVRERREGWMLMVKDCPSSKDEKEEVVVREGSFREFNFGETLATRRREISIRLDVR